MNRFLTNWGFIRIIRLLAGIGTAIYGVLANDYIFLWIAGLFLIQSLFNLSCCGYNGCSTAPSSDVKQVYKDDIKPLNFK
jgi:hypothetical protein